MLEDTFSDYLMNFFSAKRLIWGLHLHQCGSSAGALPWCHTTGEPTGIALPAATKDAQKYVIIEINILFV